MPSGYTSDLYDGKNITFRDFALKAARGMGAMIHMRDDSLDAPIRDDKPSTFYEKAMEEDKKRLAHLGTTPRDLLVKEQAEGHRKALDLWRKRQAERAERRSRYEAMLTEVNAWTPPTPDHENFQAFMREQLEESIRFDCSGSYDDPPVMEDFDQWLAKEHDRANRELARHAKHYTEEQERVTGRNRWIRDLVDSLPEPARR